MNPDELEKLPTNVQDVYNAVYVEVGMLRRKLATYYELYIEDPKHPDKVEIMNEMAGDFFGLCQIVLSNDITMNIARLRDPSESLGYQNISLEKLCNLFDTNAHRPLFVDLKIKLEKFREESKSFNRIRNKKLGHLDSDTAFNVSKEPLPGFIPLSAKNSLKAAEAIINKISLHFTGIATSKHVARPPGNAGTLLRHLRRAKSLKDKDSFYYTSTRKSLSLTKNK